MQEGPGDAEEAESGGGEEGQQHRAHGPAPFGPMARKRCMCEYVWEEGL